MEYGLIGEKLVHSFSKTVHNLICDYEYKLVELCVDDFFEFIKEKKFKGINVTIPYKEKIMPLLDFVEPYAQKIGAVNTVVNKNGKLYGYNTDYLGLKALLERNNISLNGKKVLILGSGGTSKTAVALSEDLGAGEILRVSRSEKAGYITYDNATKIHNNADVIINATPCGMYPNISECPVCIEKFGNLSAVVDAIYNPLNSQLVLNARKRKIKAVGGLYMLIAQAVFAAEIFTQKEIENRIIDDVYNKILKEKINLVLIGMPSCGKTTVGKELAEELGKEFVDSDKEIEKLMDLTVPEIFEKFGEKRFREIESQVIEEISQRQNLIIATGGGAVLDSRNIELLKSNGFVVFLDRPLDMLITSDDRPLSRDRESLKKRYDERYDIYCNSSQARVDASGNAEENIKVVKEVFFNENFSS